jgi:hypothetical protein
VREPLGIEPVQLAPVRATVEARHHTSSGAANRTSTGNGTSSPVEASQRSISARAGPTASRGIAYSISRKRTRRGDAKTSCDGAV